MTNTDVLILLKELIAAETRIPVAEIKDTETFFELGLDSISCIFLMEQVENKLSITLNPIHFWDYPTLGAYADFISTELASHG